MAYTVQLQQFEGPLDLLLHLIEEAELDVKDIFVSEITAQYLSYMDQLDELDMDTASEFLTMAATLLEIKSRALLPKPPKTDEEEDPEQALIARLTAYKQLKEGALSMQDFEKSALQVFSKLPEEIPLPPPTLEIEGLTLDALWYALRRIAERKPREVCEVDYRLRDIRRDTYTVEGCMEMIESRLSVGNACFDELFTHAAGREEVVTLFIALLELLKLGKAFATQEGTFDRIILHPGRKQFGAE